MNGESLVFCLTVFFYVPLLYAESQFECGAHGKFEYCIDGIPGCVIGCHCHPGYYFDTDSKICEPNIKLTQDFRRQYLSEPTRAYLAPNTSPPDEQPVTQNAVDEKIEEIAKDTDDLGDWLYNQFFKTIENQVINKTQGEELPPTRRSGTVLLNKPMRRSHKYWKGRKKKKNKSKGLKSKLLRITEDDSLFDSDSGSSSHYDTSSSSESNASGDEKADKKKDDHGHKKIIIFNKKPQPPLPSFIFLPNMDTPYYPPIGLPPPAMPMYPMVPVPPMLPGPSMGGPLFPFPGAVHCDSTTAASEEPTAASEKPTAASEEPTSEATVSPTTVAETKSSTATTETVTETTTEKTNSSENTNTSSNEENARLRNLLRHRQKKRKKQIARENTENNRENEAPANPLIRGNINKKLWKKLREKLNRKNKLENYFVDQYQEPDAPMDLNEPSELVSNNNFNRPNNNEMLPPPLDVDFKYLAELIHKADLNKTLNARHQPNQNDVEKVPEIQPSRRNYYPNNNMNDNPTNNVLRRQSRTRDRNDSFYTNLGRQIATMIREIDLKGEREVNIEIEGDNSKQHIQTSPVFNENNYASRSFWERSVRSPLRYLNSFKKDIDHLKVSNENLFSLENKVEIAASTVPTLSLQDLENIISTVEKVNIKPKRNKKDTVETNASFKLNLLPGNIETTQPIPKPKPVQTFRKKTSDITHELNTRRQSDANSFLLSNFRKLSPDYDDPITNTANRKDSFRNIRPTRKPSVTHKQTESALVTHLITNILPTFVKETDKINLKYQLSPVLLNHRNLKYNNHNQNEYKYAKALPIQYPGVTKHVVTSGKIEKPSYFHHFDYFDK